MDASTAVWLGLTLAAPVTLVPEIALLRLLHSKRSGWHPLDVLVVSLLVGQLCCTLVTLGLSATALARHAGLLIGTEPPPLMELLHHHRTPLCAALISFWAAAHTLHAATLTSMAVDRAMTIRWPYKYRIGVRRTQIRYHVVVLAVVSLLVGVATLFASSSSNAGSPFTSPSFVVPSQPPPLFSRGGGGAVIESNATSTVLPTLSSSSSTVAPFIQVTTTTTSAAAITTTTMTTTTMATNASLNEETLSSIMTTVADAVTAAISADDASIASTMTTAAAISVEETAAAAANASSIIAADLAANASSIITTTTTMASLLADAVAEPVVVVALPMETTCSFLPHTFDSRFALFWLCLHGVLFLTTITATVVIAITRLMMCCSTGFSGRRLGLAGGSGSDMRTLGNASDGSSATLPLPTSPSSQPPPPPPPPRYTPGPVACLSSGTGGHGTASVSPLTRSSHPALMFGSTDKTFVNMLHHSSQQHLHHLHHHHHESGMLTDSGHHKSGGSSSADLVLAADSVAATGCCCCCRSGSWNRQRHSTVAAVLIVAYLTHHLPLLVLTILGTFFNDTLPPGWPFSAIILGSSLFSGLLLMAVLVFIDPVLYGWMVDSLKPSSRRNDRHHRHHQQRSPVTSESATLEQNLAPMKIDDETRYRMSQIYSQEPTEAKFPLTNGSLFVHLMNPSSGDGKRANRRPSRMGVSAYDHRPQHQRAVGCSSSTSSSSASAMVAHMSELAYPEAIKPPLMTFMSRARILASNGSLKSANTDTSSTSRLRHHHMEPFYCDPLSGIDAPASFADDMEEAVHRGASSVGVHHAAAAAKFSHQHEPIYASLSETLSSCNTLDSLGAGVGSLQDDPPSSLLSLPSLPPPPARDAARSRRGRRQEEGRLAFGRGNNNIEEQEEDDNGVVNDDDVDDFDDDEGSATESAGDDFEFHNIRTSHQTLIPAAAAAATTTSVTHSGTAHEAVHCLEDLRPRSKVARSATYRVLCNGLNVKSAGKHDIDIDIEDVNEEEDKEANNDDNDVNAGRQDDNGKRDDGSSGSSSNVAATSKSRHGVVTCVTIKIGGNLGQAFGDPSSSLRRSKLLTSLSMNDIDVLGQSQDEDDRADRDGLTSDGFHDMPARSDSLFSLAYVEREGDVASATAGASLPASTDDSIQSLTTTTTTTTYSMGKRDEDEEELSLNQRQRQRQQQPPRQQQLQQKQQLIHNQPQSVLNLRKKSIHRSRAAVLQRFQQRSCPRSGGESSGRGNGISFVSDSPAHAKTSSNSSSSVVSIAALKAALSQSPISFLDNGELYRSDQPIQHHHYNQQQQQQSKTVFVSEYL